MSESEEESPAFPPKSSKEVPVPDVREVLMDFDLDLDNPWPMDQIAFISNPMSPLLFSSSTDQPCSPLWAFPDAENDDNSGNINNKLGRHVGSVIADSSRFSCEFFFFLLLRLIGSFQV